MTPAIPIHFSIVLLVTTGVLDSRVFATENQEFIVANSTCLTNYSTQLAEGRKLALAGRFVEARPIFQAALEREKRRDIDDPVIRACLMNLIGYAEFLERRPGVASEWFQRALALNPLPEPLLVRLTSNLASAYLKSGDLDRAEETSRRALRLAIQVFGSDHEETFFPQTTLAGVHFLRGDLDRAEPVCRRIFYQAESKWGASSYEASRAAGNLGVIYLSQHKYTLAQVHFEKSLIGLQSIQAKEPGDISLMEAGLAWCHAAGGRVREAGILLERSLASAQLELDSADPGLAAILERLASARFLLKDYSSGRQLFERAIAILETHHGPGSLPVQSGLERYAMLLRTAKDKTRARQVEERRKAFSRKP